MSVTVTTFYKFAGVADPAALQSHLRAECEQHGIKGTILIAHEGINATISGTREGIGSVLAWLRADPCFADLETKESLAETHPFKRLKVLVKPEIVTLGAPQADPAARTGVHVPPSEWNALIEDPGVTVIDTRNAYEVRIGTFKGAIDPQTRAFSQFPGFVCTGLDPTRHRRIAMFCTGGIRCEKASSYLISQGFAEVYQLDGGILKYLETVPAEESLWQGECFVFDERVALRHDLTPGTYRLCPGCGDPVPKTGPAPADASGDPCPRCAAAQQG